MVAAAKKMRVLQSQDKQLYVSNWDKIMAYRKGKAVFAFNFHGENSYDGFFLPVQEEGKYKVLFSTDDHCFGGQGRVYHQTYTAERRSDGEIGFRLYLPSRTAVVLKKE